MHEKFSKRIKIIKKQGIFALDSYANGPNSLIYHLTSWPVVLATSF
jgi:hypothetical protein